MQILQKTAVFLGLLLASHWACGQILKNNELKLALNEEATHYIKFTFANQVWLRYNESNPGSTVFGTPQAQTFDIGLRRTRFQLMAQLTDRIFFYAQFGLNNFNYLSPRKFAAFFHDATVEYAFVPKHLSLGAGLSGWSGPSRFSAPAIGTIMGLDAPIFEQATNDINDQFLRKLSVYAKGKLGKLDYRLALSHPFMIDPSLFTITNNTLPIPTLGQIGADNIATFALLPPELQMQGYLMWQFWDQEANLIPYNAGTYLGTKRVFNVGAGFVHQPNAMWYRTNNGVDTVKTAMTLFAADVFYDAPLNQATGSAISAYVAYFNNDFGPNYVRNLGIMNPANGTNAQRSFNGAGNAYPIEGTGQILYGQVGYKFKNDLLGKSGTLMPYASLQYAMYQRFKAPMALWDVGVNWLIKGHNSKITLNFQSRPVFNPNAQGDLVVGDRRGAWMLQYQIFF